ncbi:MAG: hypothetical protein R3338_14260, partial [Thermoanaerobaculia bacterium]|nr:hypothetical protein [Thermoanaerobaculia bacterium]
MRFCSTRLREATLLSLIGMLLVALPAGAEPDETALDVAERVMEALGGEDSWNATRNLVFTFAVMDGEQVLLERTHFWDKWDQLHRVEGTTREGESFVAIENLDSKTGKAWLDG